MSPPETPSSRPWRRRLAVLLVSTLVTLALAEGAARLRAHRANAETLEAAFAAPVAYSAGQGQAALGDIIRPHPDDRIAYELRPGLEAVPFKARPVSTNRLGFRSPEVPVEKGPDTVVVVGLGDSILFGHGVGDGESYLDRLGEILAAEHPDREWRTINTGVPGYNTVMEVATLERKALAFQPDLVLLGICGNDYAPPVYVRLADDVLDPTRSFFLEFLREKLSGVPGRYAEQALTHRETWSAETGQGREGAPQRYGALYGRGPFLAALDRLAELSREHGFPVLAFAMNDALHTSEMLADCAARGFATLRMQPEIEAYLAEAEPGEPFTWDLLLRSDLAVNPNNGHPSVKLHWMAARKVYGALRDEGWIARWTAGR